MEICDKILKEGGGFMETCLQNLWELIRNDISKIIEKVENCNEKRVSLTRKCEAPEKSNKIIEEFFSDLEQCFGNERKNIDMPNILLYLNNL